MARQATTFRLDADAMAALADLSKILGVAMNQLVNDAVRTYLARRTLDFLCESDSHRRQETAFYG